MYEIHSEEIRKNIIEYYEDDANSRLCSGIRECLSVKSKDIKSSELRQKRLLLYDLRDLYKNWVKDFDSDRIPSFSFFASLRPKECVLAGTPGTHTVCVCSQHQNVKLKLNALTTSLSYRDLLQLCVCSVEKKNVWWMNVISALERKPSLTI